MRLDPMQRLKEQIVGAERQPQLVVLVVCFMRVCVRKDVPAGTAVDGCVNFGSRPLPTAASCDHPCRILIALTVTPNVLIFERRTHHTMLPV